MTVSVLRISDLKVLATHSLEEAKGDEEHAISAVGFSRDGVRLAIATDGGSLHVYSLSEKAVTHSFVSHCLRSLRR